MQDHLLFIDIEASGLPKQWDVPYDEEGNWPHTVQVAWVVYTRQGQEVKQEDFYIKPEDFEVTPSSIEVHGLTPKFLLAHGQSRGQVLGRLQEDLQRYRPMVIGHFMEFDYHVLRADFQREGLPDLFHELPLFCTMAASSELMRLPRKRYLRLGELYGYLFHQTLENQHNALVDATATAQVYFELRKRGIITDQSVRRQQEKSYALHPAPKKRRAMRWPILVGLGILLSLLLLFYWL